MFSPVKIALFAFLSFAALALATPTPEGHYEDPKALISSCNIALESTLLPLNYVTSANATSDCVTPVIQEVVEIVAELVAALRVTRLSECGCTAHEIVELTAVTLRIIFGTLDVVNGSYSGLVPLLGSLVELIVELLNVVLELVGGLVWQLLGLLIRNGCAGVILDLKLDALINALGLGGLLGHL